MECLQSIHLRSILAIDCMVSKGTAAHDHEKHDLVAAITKNIYTNITMLLSQIIYIYIYIIHTYSNCPSILNSHLARFQKIGPCFVSLRIKQLTTGDRCSCIPAPNDFTSRQVSCGRGSWKRWNEPQNKKQQNWIETLFPRVVAPCCTMKFHWNVKNPTQSRC